MIPADKLLERVKLLLEEQNTENTVAISVEISPKDLELFVDQKQISQVLLNLGKNAKQSLEGLENGEVKFICGINEMNKKYIQVWDNGAGIPADLLDEIFVPFFTTKKSGTGIGLSLSKQIMRLHGGSIQVLSNEHTVFTLVFD
ncbi:ATP-binding protein [Maribacter litopenaei]|uniref:histidine kinase n=1 Tax=Maribacter litopenaei TaxID=2976127 RepID=A0ABY5Y7M6_9FLAO|nr:ATP-binding protein [Maribacter litopenaei]UWX54684.1 ATP-binding protein [Maribacter litopenaei]